MLLSTTNKNHFDGASRWLGRNLVAGLVLWAAAHVAAAQGSAAVGADFLQALRDAAHRYPLTLAAARHSQAADQDRSAAQWQQFPAPSLQRMAPQGGSNATSGQLTRLALEQPVYAGGRITASIEAAQHRYTASQRQHEQVAEESAVRIVNALYEWLRQQDRMAALREGVDAHRNLRDQIQRRAQEGVSTQIDLALAAARLSQVQSELAQANAAASAAKALMLQLTGPQFQVLAQSATALGLDGLPSPAPDAARLSLAHDPALARLAAEEAAAEADIRVKKSQFMPTVSVVAERYLGPASFNRIWLQVSAQPGAGLSSLDTVRAAVARQEAVAQSRLNAERELEQSVEADLASHAAAREQLSVGNLLRQSTQDVADSYARQFVAGRKSWLEVLNAVREAMLARLTVIDARALLGQTAWRLQVRTLGFELAARSAS